jgi:xylulokinase
MLLLGIDLGTSSIKVSVVDAESHTCIASAQFPETEVEIISSQPGWAEQSPDLWWEHTRQAILKCNETRTYNPKDITAIGIAYQMHGLVIVDKDRNVLRNSIIWCDGRAVPFGESAFEQIGEEKSLSHLLNSPGNFTASKLAWVKENEPSIYEKINKILLPGDFLAMKFTGDVTTTVSALSEGIFWDFKNNTVSEDVMNFYGFNHNILPEIKPLFSTHGLLSEEVAERLSLTQGIPVSYKAGDQPNNAFSLNVLNPGEVAATAGTSGVIYAVSDALTYDKDSRINSFAHVNHNSFNSKNNPGEHKRIGVLLCINGVGICNRWIKNMIAAQHSYESLNLAASHIPVGSDGLMMLPFGNGAERMLNNKIVGAHIHNLDFNKHIAEHLARSAQEGIAYSFRYGLDIMRENKIHPSVIRAGRANMFLSDVFTQAFVDVTGVPVELYETDGSIGAALGAGVGIGLYKNAEAAFAKKAPLKTIEPLNNSIYNGLYKEWKNVLDSHLIN